MTHFNSTSSRIQSVSTEETAMPGPVVWFEALGHHGDNLHGFYRELFGWQFDPQRAAPAASDTRRRRIPSLRARAPQRPPWWVTFYHRVPDLEDALLKARSLGSRVLVPPTRHGATTIAVVSDPEGHPVGLCSF
jgi:predicted enzyme related to lactoylglutathione lyase